MNKPEAEALSRTQDAILEEGVDTSVEIHSPLEEREDQEKKAANQFFSLLYGMENHFSSPYESGIAHTAEKIDNARKLHADVYQKWGYVDPEDVDENGHLIFERDPYAGRSRYFLVERQGNSEDRDSSLSVPVAGGRQIEAENNSFDSFQFFKNTGIGPEELDVLKDLFPEECVEVSALVKAKGEKPISVLHLYREMLDYSQEANHKLWLMVINVGFYEKLQLLFGDTVQQVGEPAKLDHLNMTVVPAVLDPRTALEDFQEKSQRSKDPLEKRYVQAVTNFFAHK